MKALEDRRWFLFLSLTIASILMVGYWYAGSLPITLAAACPFMFATLGLWMGIDRGLALVLIRYKPALGEVG